MNTRNAPLPRRGFLLGLTAVGAAVGLAGCGFELRKAPIFAFKTLSLTGNSFFVNQLRRDLRAAGTVTLVPPDQANTADAVLEVLGEDRDRFIVSTDSAGLLREVQLRLRIRFRLRTPGGKELLAATEVMQTRDLSYNETNALAKEAEAELLYRDMQTDIGQQVMRRLAAVKSL
jgi:LPS-assembly lipoprotein